VLSALVRDQDAVQSLAVLYVEARFSRHEITEEHRERAIAALRRVHGSLLRRVTTGPETHGIEAVTSPDPLR
jgi:hypothetical protein